MDEAKRQSADRTAPSPLGAEKARAALVARLGQLYRQPVKPPKSLQPTPEAGKSKIRRLRLKQRLLIQKSKTIPPR